MRRGTIWAASWSEQRAYAHSTHVVLVGVVTESKHCRATADISLAGALKETQIMHACTRYSCASQQFCRKTPGHSQPLENNHACTCVLACTTAHHMPPSRSNISTVLLQVGDKIKFMKVTNGLENLVNAKAPAVKAAPAPEPEAEEAS